MATLDGGDKVEEPIRSNGTDGLDGGDKMSGKTGH